jgi:CheY-like chemotaxis protein
MAKILLVEDDNNLREIYEARLQAEGYDIVSARDGEEALVVAKAELPDLVISDVMMPKISGFEMLDILRNTEGLKDVKVIMLTALGQAEDQTRADSLGADRYLVKSQVTLEDIVNAAQQLLTGDQPAEATPAAEAAPEPPVEPVPTVEPVAPVTPETTTPETDTTPPVIPLAAAPPDDAAVPTEPQMPPTPASTIPDVPVEEPVTAPAEPVAPTGTTGDDDQQQTNAQEAATVEQQIEDFVDSQPATPPPAVEPAPDSTPEATPTTTPEEEQALNDAVTSLSGEEAAAPVATPTAAEPTPAPEVPQVPETPVMPTPAAEPVTAPEPTPTPVVADDAESPSHKKVIVPISDEETPKKSLEELLAEEDAKETAQSTDTPAAEETTKPQPNKGDFDPNSIAL